MEPNKLEYQFRKKLNEREISPPENSWDRLDAMLTVAEETKQKHSYHWIYIAASFIGFLIIGTVFFSQTQELIDVRRNEVVNTEDNTGQPAEKMNEEKRDVMFPFVNSSENEIVGAVATTPKSDKKVKTTFIEENNQVAEISEKNKIETPLDDIKQTPVLTPESLAVIIPSDETGNSSVKVDAHNLLSQVDGELEFTFREKIIQTANKNYKSVKIALANRNQE
jgi:hypothetical protein